jgi:LysM repeat protein
MKFFLLPFLLLCGCASQFAALRNDHSQDIALEELRVEVGDVKHTLHAQQVEIRLLEEKLEKEGSSKVDALREEIALLERKITFLEKSQSHLTSHANQTSASLVQYRDQIVELDRRLEGRARGGIGHTSSSKTYKVVSGDSLEKIARLHHTTVPALKQVNHLSSDRIVVGQELQIPHE